MCRPAGAILHPLGRSVAPRSRPGRSTVFRGCANAGETAAANSAKRHVQPGAEKIFIAQGYNGKIGKSGPCGEGDQSHVIPSEASCPAEAEQILRFAQDDKPNCVGENYAAGSPISVKSGVRATPGCSCFLNQDPRGLGGIPGCGWREEMIRRGCVTSFSSRSVASGCQAVPVEIADFCMASPPITVLVLQDPFPPQVTREERLACDQLTFCATSAHSCCPNLEPRLGVVGGGVTV